MDRYDAFVIDLWGVLHDGLQAYSGVRETLMKLKDNGKKTVLLSNAPRRAAGLIEMMEDLGLPRESYGDLVSSGDAVHYALRDRIDPAYASLGSKAFMIGPDRSRDILDGIPYTFVDRLEDADFYLCTGPFTYDDVIDDFEPLMDQCARNMKPMICANPDRAVIRDGKVVVCAGNIADLYKARGGQVHETGKPDPAVYDLALRTVGVVDRSRVAGIGDSFATDMRGCRSSRIDGILCARGIHAKGLGIEPGQSPSPEAVSKLAAEYDVYPTAVIPAFIW